MEPQFFNCGNEFAVGQTSGVAPASMEPQFFNCGNVVDVREKPFSKLLQWSRSFSTAEILNLAAKLLGNNLLQWSRSFSTAEINIIDLQT